MGGIRHVQLRLWLLQFFIWGILSRNTWMDSTDLTNFVSRPDLKVPRLLVNSIHPELVSPGYWFMGPYAHLDPEPFSRIYRPCQVGPAIYDNNGELIWSGACTFSNRNAFDFKLSHPTISGNATLSLILGMEQPGAKGSNMILNSALEAEFELPTISDLAGAYMHEFSVLKDGKTAVVIAAENRFTNVSELMTDKQVWWIRDEGIMELDLLTKTPIFQWWAMDHIPYSETPDRPPIPFGDLYDVYHLNSIEKTALGDYLISMRHTNTIYLISAQDGHVIWRLGGQNSSFTHIDSFTFSGQHDARIVTEHSNGTIIISFFDNAGATMRPKEFWTSTVSSAVVVELDTGGEPKTARLLKKYTKPDGRISDRRGNSQLLPNNNIIGAWSAGGYFSEFIENGTLVFEGRFRSARMSTYRTYKFGLDRVKLYPSEPIALVCKMVQVNVNGEGSTGAGGVSIMHVSWNGATEVRRWTFALGGGGSDQSIDDDHDFVVVGSKQKRGFETAAQFHRIGRYAIAIALDQDGKVLGKSDAVKCESMVEAGSELIEMPEPEAAAKLATAADESTEEEEEEEEEEGASNKPDGDAVPPAVPPPATALGYPPQPLTALLLLSTS